VDSYRRLVHLGHVKTLDDGSAEAGVGTTCEELVELDEETVVGVGGFDDLGRDFMSGTASSCFQINSHFCSVWLNLCV